MSSILITYGLLGFPFLFAIGSLSDDNKNYGQWLSLGFTISFAIFVLRYIRVAVKWQETKQYMLNKLGLGDDPGTNKKLESSFGYYWKNVVFFPAWFFNYLIFPQNTSNLVLSYVITSILLFATVYSSLADENTTIGGTSINSNGLKVAVSAVAVGIAIFASICMSVIYK